MGRVEVITGVARRRRWSEEDKARLVAETRIPGAIISRVARRHGVAESCLYAWRRQLADEGRAADEPAPLLIPVRLESAVVARQPGLPLPDRLAAPRARITFADGTRLEVDSDYPASELTALIAAVTGRR